MLEADIQPSQLLMFADSSQAECRTRHNPLIPALLAVLRNFPQGLSEYELLQQLQSQPVLQAVTGSANLQLFRRHFLLMNALYSLQQQLWQEHGLYLLVSPLRIGLQQRRDPSAGLALSVYSESQSLRDYYADWQVYAATGEADVEQLLNSFWRRYVSADERTEALALLGLEVGVEAPALKRRYRELAQAHHPDRGGDCERFIAIRRAYEILR